MAASHSRAEAVERTVIPDNAGLYGHQALIAMFGIMTVVLLAALDQTIVGTALPRVVAELGGFDLYAWVATSYLLTSTIMVPIMGKFGDLYGRKPFLLLSIIIFVGASALAGAANSMIWLIIARGIQGIGAGMLQATAFTSVGDMFPQPERRARWQGLITSVFGISSVIGPTLGGVMTDSLGWRSVFYVNLPIGIIAFAMIWKVLPANLSPRTPNAKIDWAGAALITLAISSLLLLVEWGGSTYAWTSAIILLLGALCIVGLLGFVLVEFRAPAALMPPTLFANRTVFISSILSALFGFVMFAVVYYSPLLFQGGFGISASAAGALQTPLALSTAVGSLLSAQTFARIRRMKPLMVVGGIVMVVGGASLLLINANSNPWVISFQLGFTGVGLGMQLPLLTILVQSVVPRSQIGVGTASIQFLRLIGSTIGTAIVGAAITNSYTSNINSHVSADINQQLLQAFHNPQALVSSETQEQIQQIAQQLGKTGLDQLSQLQTAAASAMIDSIKIGYLLALALAVIILILIVILPLPDFRAAQTPSQTEQNPMPEAI